MVTGSEDNFVTVGAGPYRSEIKIQGSRFITHIFHVKSQNEALSKYHQVKKKFYDASHNCFAYRIDRDQFRYSDDGEPSGTAGKPIFQVIEGQEMRQILIIVTRYFGGTKLGTGGLIRAYSEAARKGLDQSHKIEKIRCKEIKIATRYELLHEVREIISKYKGTIVSSDYSDKVVLICHVPLGTFGAFQDEMIHNIEISEL